MNRLANTCRIDSTLAPRGRPDGKTTRSEGGPPATALLRAPVFRLDIHSEAFRPTQKPDCHVAFKAARLEASGDG